MANRQPKNEEAEKPEAKAVAKPSVAVKAIRWARSGWSKQKNEGQNDTMGGYQGYVALVKPDGTRIVIQEKGKPTKAIPTFQRQLIKVTVAAWFTSNTSKGDMFLDTISLNLKAEEDTAFLAKLGADGWSIDTRYGAKRKLYTTFANYLGVLGLLSEARTSTLAQYPPEVDEASGPEVDETVVEEVGLVL